MAALSGLRDALFAGVTIPAAVMPAASQAPAPSAAASKSAGASSSDANADASTGFAEALHDVANAEATPATRKAPTARQTPKNSKDKNEDGAAAPIAVMLPMQTPTVIAPIALPTHGDARSDSESLTGGQTQEQAAGQAVMPAAPSTAGPTDGPVSRNMQAGPAKPPMPSGAPGVAPELTFAARVQPAQASGESASKEQHPSHPDPAAAAPAPAPKKVIESEPKQQTATNSSESKSTAAKGADPAPAQADVQPAAAAAKPIAAFEQSGRLVPPPPAAPSTPSKPVEAAVPVDRLTAPIKAAPQPLKDVSIEVAPPGVQKVEVRLVQQSGELRVAVRTADPDLAHGLREGLPELVGRLQENGNRAEAWRPGVTPVATASQAAQTSNTSGRNQSGDTPQHSGGQQDSGQRQRQSSNRPEWVDELESSLTGAAASQGESTWHPQLTL